MYRDIRAAGLRIYEGPIGDFSPESIPADFREEAEKHLLMPRWLPAVNELEMVAAAFTTGVADEQTAFGIIGRSFCAVTKMNYVLIASSRIHKNSAHYQPIIDLYSIWSPRLSAEELEIAQCEIERRLAAIPRETIRPIGTD